MRIMHWTVAARFTRDPAVDRWLIPFVRSDRHDFSLIPAPPAASWHVGGPVTSAGEWAKVLTQGGEAWRRSKGGVVTVFPQLAWAVGLCQRASPRQKPVVAWTFNMGALYGGLRGLAARTALAAIDRFVVHSRGEIPRYARWLRLPRERFEFLHLTRAPIPIEEAEDARRPFVLAMGSAHRDYATFMEVARQTRLPAVVVAAPHSLRGLEIPANVEVRSALPARACHRLAQRARVNVVPVSNEDTASGQVTIVEAMRMRRTVVATKTMGSADYIEDGANGLLAEPHSVESLKRAIVAAWDDSSLRERLARSGEAFVAKWCSDEAAGATLRRILDEVTDAQVARA